MNEEHRYLTWLSENGFRVSISNVDVDIWMVAVDHRRTDFKTSFVGSPLSPVITEAFKISHKHLRDSR